MPTPSRILARQALTRARQGSAGGGLTGTVTFYAAAGSGGSVDVLNTVTIVDGLITAWTQGTPGTPGEWQFDDAANSGHLLTSGF